MSDVVLVGRSSSHFTRVARMAALELDVAHEFRPVLDITTLDRTAYAGNPALKIPILLDEGGPLYGTENICRELSRRSTKGGLVARGAVSHRLVANAEELTLHVMSSEVALIVGKLNGFPPTPKVVRSLEGSLEWLEQNLDGALAALPKERQTSFFEIALFAVMAHLPWREVLDVSPWKRLLEFRETFGERESAKATPYRFDT